MCEDLRVLRDHSEKVPRLAPWSQEGAGWAAPSRAHSGHPQESARRHRAFGVIQGLWGQPACRAPGAGPPSQTGWESQRLQASVSPLWLRCEGERHREGTYLLGARQGAGSLCHPWAVGLKVGSAFTSGPGPGGRGGNRMRVDRWASCLLIPADVVFSCTACLWGSEWGEWMRIVAELGRQLCGAEGPGGRGTVWAGEGLASFLPSATWRPATRPALPVAPPC